MTLSFLLLLVAVGVVALSVGGRFISRAVVALADYAGVSEFFVALFLLAFSTSLPEFFVGVSAALKGVPSLSLGDVFGSNIVNLTLIAGVVLLLGRRQVVLAGEMTKRDSLWIFGVSSLPVVLLLDGALSRLDGAVLLGSFLLHLGRLWLARRQMLSPVPGALAGNGDGAWLALSRERRRKLIRALGFFVVGAVLLLGGARAVVDAARLLAEHLQVAPFLVGVLVVAVGTSLPEFAFGIRAALSRKPEVSMGDVIGSAVVNSCWILGVVALIHPIVPAAYSAAIFSGVFMMAVFAVFSLLLRSGGALSPREGLLLVVLYAFFLLVQTRL